MSSNRDAEAGVDNMGLLRCLILGAWPGTGRDRRNQLAVLRWSILLAVGLLGSVFVLRQGYGAGAALKWAIAAVPIALVIPWLLSQLRFLREADELVRRIQLEGLAVGFWAAFAFGIVYTVLGRTGIPRLDPGSGLPLMVAVLGLGYAFGRVLASKRYR
jgi:hypothetical protein